MRDNDTLTYDIQSISTVFKKFFLNLAESLLTKLPNPPDKYNLESVINHYSTFTITDVFCLNKTSEDNVLKIILKIETSNAASIDRLSGHFLMEVELRFYQGLYLKSGTYQYPVKFSLILKKLQN